MQYYGLYYVTLMPSSIQITGLMHIEKLNLFTYKIKYALMYIRTDLQKSVQTRQTSSFVISDIRFDVCKNITIAYSFVMTWNV